jgi:ERCC4-type nuclease
MLEIVLDVREHALIEKLNALSASCPNNNTLSLKTEQLLLGDAAIRNQDQNEVLLFERKSLTDLLASIKDGRYEEQSHRLIHTAGLHPHNIIYVVEGVFSTLRNPADKKVILSAMTSLSYFKGFSVFRTSAVFDTAELIWAMACKLDKEFSKGREGRFATATLKPPPQPAEVAESSTASQQSNFGPRESVDESQLVERMPPQPPATESYSTFVKKAKRDNITPENIGEILLCQIPGISTTVAQAILGQYEGSFSKLLEGIKTDPDKLAAICTETNGKRRRISSAVVQSILTFLTR